MLKDANVIAFSLVKLSVENIVSFHKEASGRRFPCVAMSVMIVFHAVGINEVDFEWIGLN